MTIPAAVDALFAEQGGAATRAQLAALGLSHDHIRGHVTARRWRTIGPLVVAGFTGTPTRTQRWWIAVLHAGPTAQLAGLTAAEAHGLHRWSTEVLHVRVPHLANPPRLDGVRVHRTRGWRTHGGEPARSPAPDSLVDAASWMKTDAAAAGVLAAGVQQRIVTAPALRVSAAKAHGRRNLIRNICADLEGGAEALSEIRLGHLAARAGLPAPIRQIIRVDPQGRRRYLDADFGAFAVEIDGMAHLDPERHADDLERQNDLVMEGLRLLRFSALRVRTQPDRVVAQLRRARDRWC